MIKKYVFGCLLGWMDGKFAAKNPTPALGPLGLALRPFEPQYLALWALKFGPSGLNLPPQILKASAVPGLGARCILLHKLVYGVAKTNGRQGPRRHCTYMVIFEFEVTAVASGVVEGERRGKPFLQIMSRQVGTVKQ